MTVLPSRPTTAPSVRRCLTTRELVRLRAAGEIPLPLARHLASHLSHPCAKCWKAIDAVGKVVHRRDSDGLPIEPEGWEPSTHPVILALRTLGDWPSRQWLRPTLRTALDGARERLGFLMLVLEICRVSIHEAERRSIAIESWSKPLEAVLAADPVATQVRGRALVYRAEAESKLDLNTAASTLDAAERLLASTLISEEAQALLTSTRARISEVRHPQLAMAYLELAADRLVSTSKGLRAEILLELAELHIRHGEPNHAGQALGRAAQLLGEADETLVLERLKCQRARWSLLAAEEAMPGVQKLVAHAITLGRWGNVLDLPRSLDPLGWHERQELRARLDATRLEHSTDGVRQALAYLGASERATVAFEADLRAVLAASLMADDQAAAEEEIAWLRQALADSPGLFLRLERSRDALSGALEAFPTADVRALAEPLLEVLDRLREPVVDESALAS